LREARPRPGPGASSAPGARGARGGQGAEVPSGPASAPGPGENADRPSGQQGDPIDDRAPGQPTPGDLRALLEDFRSDLDYDQALQVLDALRGQQRGIEQLLEGPRRTAGTNPEY
ncbi:MAG: hypothetical protein AAB295_05490, partial [Chloroflexota bacterium]